MAYNSKMFKFIIKWEVLDSRTTTILGFTNNDECIRIVGFKPYIYISSRTSGGSYRFLRGNREACVTKICCRSTEDIRSITRKSKVVYESDIRILIKFISEKRLDFIGWIEIKSSTECKDDLIKISICSKEYIVNIENIFNANSVVKDIPPIKILSFDIECYTEGKGMSDARKSGDCIFMISMLFDHHKRDSYVLALKPKKIVEQTQKYKDYKLLLFDDEFEMLSAFFDMIRDQNPDMIIGYNIMGFDMKYILQKYYSLLMNIPQAGRIKDNIYRDEIIYKSWSTQAYGSREYAIFNFMGRCCFDVYSYVSMELTMQKYSLDFVSKEILGRGKVDLSYESMFKKYSEGKVVEISDYCYIDSALTSDLWVKLNLWYTVVEQCKLYKVNVHEMYSSGQQKRIFNQLYYYAHPRGYIFDKENIFRKTFQYQGASVIDPVPGVYKNVAVVDFASLYPSIIISKNICYTTMIRLGDKVIFNKEQKGVVPEVLENLISSRKELKKLLRDEKDPVMRIIYDKRQYAYKVCANSFYGAFGSRDDQYLQMIEAAEEVTSCGRYLLNLAIKAIEEKECKVVYGDTDSCFFIGDGKNLRLEDIEKIVADINCIFPKPVHVEYEKVIDKLLLLTKKRYVYVSLGSYYFKGVINARRDTCFWVREIYKFIVKMVIEGSENEDVNRYLRKEFIRLLSGNIDLDKLYINRTVGSNYVSKTYTLSIFKNILQDFEGREITSGERLEYYFIKSNNRLQGYHCATLKMIQKYKLEVDYEFYIMHQLKGPITQIYSILGWTFY